MKEYLIRTSLNSFASTSGRRWVLVDMDGTLADHRGVRAPYAERQVGLDNPYPVIVKWVKTLFEDYNIGIVSGRHDSCGDETCDWLKRQGINFDLALFRHNGDDRDDVIVKKEMLDAFRGRFGQNSIAFVLDDRPKVVRMWRENGVTVYPVRGELEEF